KLLMLAYHLTDRGLARLGRRRWLAITLVWLLALGASGSLSLLGRISEPQVHMAAGLPCIANHTPPNREVLDDGKAGVLIPVENCDALETAIRDMVEDDGMARHFALKVKERAEQCYSIESVAAQYVNLYESLLACPDKAFSI